MYVAYSEQCLAVRTKIANERDRMQVGNDISVWSLLLYRRLIWLNVWKVSWNGAIWFSYRMQSIESSFSPTQKTVLHILITRSTENGSLSTVVSNCKQVKCHFFERKTKVAHNNDLFVLKWNQGSFNDRNWREVKRHTKTRTCIFCPT